MTVQSMMKALRAALLFAVCWGAASVSIGAQEPPPADQVTPKFTAWTQTLDRLSRELATLKLDSARLDQVDEALGQLTEEVGAFKEDIEPFANEARDLRDTYLASLQSGVTETPDIQAQKKTLEDRYGLLEGWQSQADLILARGGQLQDKISAQRINILVAALTVRGVAAANPLAWPRAALESWTVAGVLAPQLSESLRTWIGPQAGQAARVWGFACVLWLAGWFAMQAAARRSWPALGPALVGPWTQTSLDFSAAALPWLLAAGSLALAGDWGAGTLLPTALVPLAAGLLNGLLILGLGMIGLARAVEALPAAADQQAIRRDGTALLILLAIETALAPLLTATTAPNLAAVWALIFTALSLLFTRAFARGLQAAFGSDAAVVSRFLLLVLPSLVLALQAFTVIAALVGYGSLGRYLTANVFDTLLLLVVAGVLRAALQESLPRAFDAAGPAGRALAVKLGADQATLRLIQFWLGILLDIVIPLAALFCLTIVWGAGREDAIMLGRHLIEGIRVGNVTLSITDLLFAILAFMIGIWITRLAQRFLDKRVFPGTQLDTGVRNSLRSGLGYIGVMVAAAVAVAVLGVNLSSLGLIVGALSVGIGFGLQNIVNNFVSGLILLIERPVKVGDRIVVAGNEGVVKRINVRATEIIDENRASVLVPNADFLGGAVINWTHKDQSARLHLTFRTPEALGAEGGRDLLIACATAHPEAQKTPAPSVLLKEIGDGYGFELVVDIANAERMDEVASDLRFAVDKALRQLPA